MCYILYHPLDSELTLSDAGVIIERAHEWTVKRGVEEVFFSKVSRNFLEIFEKSIDKHKIDAILNAPSFANGLFWAVWQWAGEYRRIPRKNPVYPSRYRE